MVALQVHLEDEEGIRLVSVWDRVGVADFVWSRSEGTICMRFIDRYGETIFNGGQCVVLRREWSALSDDAPENVRRWIADVAGLIERCATDVHLYLRFSGD
jgi:hypothetical protein